MSATRRAAIGAAIASNGDTLAMYRLGAGYPLRHRKLLLGEAAPGVTALEVAQDAALEAGGAGDARRAVIGAADAGPAPERANVFHMTAAAAQGREPEARLPEEMPRPGPPEPPAWLAK
jgi:hypothetical protein